MGGKQRFCSVVVNKILLSFAKYSGHKFHMIHIFKVDEPNLKVFLMQMECSRQFVVMMNLLDLACPCLSFLISYV